MTSSQALSAHFPATADSEAARHDLRAADLIVSPVRWPVHQLSLSILLWTPIFWFMGMVR